MGATIRVNDRPVFATGYCFNGSIQHRIDQAGVRSRTDSPADHQAIEAVDHGREVHLSSGDLKLGDVGQPLLIGFRRLEVAVCKVN
jgi:hypothetical protein